jgi:GTP cyclohydrolase I
MGTVAVSKNVTWAEIYEGLNSAPKGRLYGIPRGGAIVAGLTGRAVDRIEDADWIVDDVIDTGATVAGLPGAKPAWGLFDRARDGLGDKQLIFPWDTLSPRHSRRGELERLGADLLQVLGYDVASEGLRDTPARWARWWEEFHTLDTSIVSTTFRPVVDGQFIVVGGIRVWSMCEHHLLPFRADVSIGYRSGDRLLGLSKFARVARRAAKRLQLQERLTGDIADDIEELSGSSDVAVLLRSRHLCMEARGAETEALVTTIAERGAFRTDGAMFTRFLAVAECSAVAFE